MNYSVKIKEASKLVENMISSKKYYFEDLAVAYAIADKNTLETLYVGRTQN